MDEKKNRGVVLFIATIGAFVTPFMSSSINVAMPTIGHEFSLNAISLNWIATSYLLAAAVFLVPFGRIGDIYGRKKIYLYGTIIYALSSFLCAVSFSEPVFIVFRVLQGIGSAMIFGTGIAMLTSAYPPNERGKVLGINVAATYIGLSAGPFLGGLMTQHIGWRSIFTVNGILGIVVIVLIVIKLKDEWTGAAGEKFDFIGSIIYSFSLVILMYGFSKLPSVNGIWMSALGLTGIAAFTLWENRVKSAVLDISLFKNNRVFVLSSIAALINYSATFAVGYLMSLYLQYIKGYSPEHAGFILVAQPIMQALFSPAAGRLSDKMEPRIIASSGMGLTAAGLLFLLIASEKTSLILIIVSLMLLGFGFALFSSPNTNAVMGSVEKKFYGVASGILGTMRLLGQMFSMGIVMIVSAIYIGKVQITPDKYPLFMHSLQTTFIILTALCTAGVFASLSRGSVQK